MLMFKYQFFLLFQVHSCPNDYVSGNYQLAIDSLTDGNRTIKKINSNDTRNEISFIAKVFHFYFSKVSTKEKALFMITFFFEKR